MAKLIAKNKDAYYKYIIDKKIEAGIVLTGNEVKSIRNNNVSITGAYISIKNNEIFVKNMHISQYMNNVHDELRARKLLLHKNEILRLSNETLMKNFSIIPISLIISKSGFIKLEIGIGKSKTKYDKREEIKERDIKRAIKNKFNI